MDENDVALIDAIHVNPRATFEQLGTALGMSASTAARRWRALEDSGEVWVSSVPGPALVLTGAAVRIDCDTADLHQVTEALVDLPQVASLQVTTGDYALYALVVTSDRDALASLILDGIGQIPGIRRLSTAVMVRLFGGRQWNLGALDPAQRAEVKGRTLSPPARRSGAEVDEADRALFLALQYDGRMGFRELGEHLDLSEKAAKRRLEKLVQDDRIAFRADFVRSAAGWPFQIVLWLAVPPRELRMLTHALVGIPQSRVCAEVVSSANVFVTFQMHRVEELPVIEERIAAASPGARVLERLTVLRSVKSWGRVLGPDGRAVRVVPVDMWA
ncbi:MAG TPA: Lrp/AsnC family transcriptional regulator [Actinomycetales bacterium]|nr:Lrp/AsnC family transcriptional regulator [Actinomycetales bacterium]